MAETSVVVRHSSGLHARPASLFVQTAKKFRSQVRVQNTTTGTQSVDAKSIIGVLTLGVLQNHEIYIQAEGEDCHEAVAGLFNLVQSNFEVS